MTEITEEQWKDAYDHVIKLRSEYLSWERESVNPAKLISMYIDPMLAMYKRGNRLPELYERMRNLK